MHPRSLALLATTFLAVIVFVLFAFRLQPVWSPETDEPIAAEVTQTQPSVTYVSPKKGAENPALVLVEFADFQCEPCKEFASTLDVIVRTEPSVSVVWKNMPNESLHPLATPAAIAAHCAGQQGKFWEYHDALFDRQAVLNEALFAEIAANLSLEEKTFDRCFENRDTLALVKKDFEEALALGIPATPALFIGEDAYIGATDLEELLTIIRERLANP